MIPLFAKYINNWLEDLPKNTISQQEGTFVQDMMKASKQVVLRLITLTMYGEAFDEAVKNLEMSYYELRALNGATGLPQNR